MRTVFTLFLLLAAMTSVIGRQPGSARTHLLVAYRTVGMIVPGLTPLVVLDVPEDAIFPRACGSSLAARRGGGWHVARALGQGLGARDGR